MKVLHLHKKDWQRLVSKTVFAKDVFLTQKQERNKRTPILMNTNHLMNLQKQIKLNHESNPLFLKLYCIIIISLDSQVGIEMNSYLNKRKQTKNSMTSAHCDCQPWQTNWYYNEWHTHTGHSHLSKKRKKEKKKNPTFSPWPQNMMSAMTNKLTSK